MYTVTHCGEHESFPVGEELLQACEDAWTGREPSEMEKY